MWAWSPGRTSSLLRNKLIVRTECVPRLLRPQQSAGNFNEIVNWSEKWKPNTQTENSQKVLSGQKAIFLLSYKGAIIRRRQLRREIKLYLWTDFLCFLAGKKLYFCPRTLFVLLRGGNENVYCVSRRGSRGRTEDEPFCDGEPMPSLSRERNFLTRRSEEAESSKMRARFGHSASHPSPNNSLVRQLTNRRSHPDTGRSAKWWNEWRVNGQRWNSRNFL